MSAESGKVRIGTSAFTAAGWPGTFYPEELPAKDYLSYYATRFDTVEVDSTFYGTPKTSTVIGWAEKTPKGFIFAAKVPQTITHDQVLTTCDDDFTNFVKTMDVLGDKLGPLLLQFPYFNKAKFKSLTEFLAVLEPFLTKLPKGHRFALEIRNKNWLQPKFTELLKAHGVALACIDQAWMPSIDEVTAKLDPITADFCYVRWLGDRKGIELETKVWDKTIIDRSDALKKWVKFFDSINHKVDIYAYANNHYAGHGPATVALFKELWDRQTT
jgi:uncharacterized protein YecE (DUF72 family)